MPRRQATRGSPSGEHGRSVRHRHGWSSQHRILPGAWAAPRPCRRGRRRPARNGAKPWRKWRSRPGAPSPPRRACSRHERTEGTTAARQGPCPPCRPRRWPSSPLKALPAVSGIDWRLALESVDGKHDRLQKRAASFVREDGTAPAILRASLEAATTSACGRWPTSPGRARPAWAHSTWPPSPATWNWTCAAAGSTGSGCRCRPWWPLSRRCWPAWRGSPQALRRRALAEIEYTEALAPLRLLAPKLSPGAQAGQEPA